MHETPIERFARHILGKPLYPYQVEPANAILYSIEHNLGWIITVMMSRQSGKNQLSAVLEAFLLWTRCRQGGSIIKAAPTFTPQIVNSQARLMSMLETERLRSRIWTSFGKIGLAPSSDRKTLLHHVGPYVQFFSADPDANVVGATATLLLEIDEAQDVSPDKFNTDFRPMAATSNATTILYGTAWTEDTLLARQRATNLEHFARTGEQRHFEYPWQHCAKSNPNYKKFVEAEIERLGEEHISIQTQYFLQPVSGAGYFLNALQRQLIQGAHRWEDESDEDELDTLYVAGLDVGGEERADPDDPGKQNTKRDSSVLTIGRIRFNELGLPLLEIIHQHWWTGMHHLDQYVAVSEMMEKWPIRRLVCDATGEGAGLASLLVERWSEERVGPFRFTRPSKSKLGFQILTLVNSGRLKLYQRENSPPTIFDECWQQLQKARYQLPAADIINFYVQPGEGHDDFVMSIALCTEALEGLLAPAGEATIIKSRQFYPGESRF